MKKIKIVVSDFHLGKGIYLSDGSVNVLEEFFGDRQWGEFLNHFSNGPYKDLEVELVLNGDIFDLIKVDYRGYYSPILTEAISVEKLQSVLDGHPLFVSALKKFASLSHHKITYVVGNHDVEMIWPRCQELFSRTLGCEVQFFNFSYIDEGIHIEHGQQFENTNRINPKQMYITKNLREPIINLPWGSHFVINYVLPIKMQRIAVDRVRPVSAFIRWSLWHDTTWCLKNMMRVLLYFFGTRFSKSIYRTTNLMTTFKILKELFRSPQLLDAAKDIFQRNKEVKTVVMGHTHVFDTRQFEDGKQYLNTGTWTEVTSLELNSFGRYTKFHYALIELEKDSQGLKLQANLREWRGKWHEDVSHQMG
jgi:UDP-2,3-diacylglucosamine pyrophosphatase LpxH